MLLRNIGVRERMATRITEQRDRLQQPGAASFTTLHHYWATSLPSSEADPPLLRASERPRPISAAELMIRTFLADPQQGMIKVGRRCFYGAVSTPPVFTGQHGEVLLEDNEAGVVLLRLHAEECPQNASDLSVWPCSVRFARAAHQCFASFLKQQTHACLQLFCTTLTVLASLAIVWECTAASKKSRINS